MKLTKCSNNHFYDGDKYSQCPHCGASKESGKETIKEVVSEKNQLLEKVFSGNIQFQNILC